MFRLSRLSLAPLSALVLAIACSDASGPASRTVRLSFASRDLTPGALRMSSLVSGAQPVTVTIGANTVVITKAQLILRNIELEPAEVADCSSTNSSDGCDEIELGPVLVDLPLTAGVSAPIMADIPAGTYKEIEFELHKLSNDPGDAQFLAANPGFNGISMRVEGTFNGTPFVFTTDQGVEREVQFNPPIVVAATGAGITINVDVSTWFVVSGQVVNPAQANTGGQHESAVEENIKNSFKGYRDDDRDGDEG